MNTLQGTIVAVTGAFGALGLVTARVLAQRGAQVALLGRGAAPATLPRELAHACVVDHVDLTDPQAAEVAVATIVGRFGALNALVNVAGGFRWETIAGGSADSWDQLFDSNVKTALNASKAALAQLTAGGAGRIVNLGALAALKAGTGMGAYTASKSAVMRLTEALADELKDKGVTVNAILPSIIDTPQNRADMPEADFARWVTPEQIAGVIAFLLSQDAQCVTGALIPVAGRV
ncbi:SDR family NAD(P)-dependent oxidoreductase [Paraburkholderia sp. SOS3]|jgi:NAD(P)-dependent dehydrogenase (short-subunit alcohol dehydrogenase family)|uniref:SDR family NAD(P)-dependent oxidoreductase n=1 Tax=Paraburkholderia sp. SOS3 TaxID=1926494 RepID=UPI0009473B99|nr:SDR family NAD(P)-dependent oxidoreductase [Paraburkholderia sp. SOS3]APR38879.1 3-oxoacyl-[acyl-carrier-protein] reductase [Paraburkholderia sp. SOS3]